MAVVSVVLPVHQGGRSVLTLNFSGIRSGGDNDRQQYRIVRRVQGQADVALIGTPDITLTAGQDVRSWTWIDDSIPFTGTAEYVLQIKRVTGAGTIHELVLLGQHFKR